MKDIWIGFDLGGTKMLAAAYDKDMKPIARRRRKTRGRDGGDNGIARIVSTISRLLSENDLDLKRIAGIGIGCPGPIDLDAGRLLSTPNLGWDDVDVQTVLSKQFACRVAVLNDVDAGIYGEYRFGAAEGSRCTVGIFPGTGIGGGCVYEGKILQGAGISCMEIGHTRISSGVRCSGGEIPGTLETEASRLAIAAEAAKLAYRGEAPALLKSSGTDLAEIRSGSLADSVKNGDQAVKRLIEEAAIVLGYAVVNVVHMLCPDKIVLGGGLVEAMEDLILEQVRKTARECVMPVYKDRFKIVVAKLGDDAGVMGAAAWAKLQYETAVDAENILEAKNPIAKKDDVKKDDVKKDDVKKDDVKKDDVKKDDVKKDNAKTDDVKKDDVKKDETKKDEVKKDETKKAETPHDLVKKPDSASPKQDAPKKAES